MLMNEQIVWVIALSSKAMRKIWFVIGLSLFACVAALGDGGMFRQASTDTPTVSRGGVQEVLPAIPRQRAVLKYENGIETMIVQSTIDGPVGEYGWVVPVPTKPQFLKPVKPDYIERTFEQIKVPVKSTQGIGLLPATLCMLGATLFLTAAMRREKSEPGKRFTFYMLEAFLVVLMFSVYTALQSRPQADIAYDRPTDSAANMSKASNAGVEKEVNYGTIGAYEVKAIQDNSGKAVMKWLDENKFYVPNTAAAVIEKYAKEGWWFVASHFRKDVARPLPPHPLKVVFESEKLVYPMRLTGIQDKPLYLELLIVGDRRLDQSEMKTRRHFSRDLLIYVPKDRINDKDIYNEWKGDLFAMAKEGMASTYLVGEIHPHQMRKDFEFERNESTEEFTAELYDRQQAKEHLWALFCVAIPFTAFGLGFGLQFLRKKVTLFSGIAAAVSLAIAYAYGYQWYASVEKVDTDYVSQSFSMQME